MSAFSDEYGWLLELPGPVYLGAQDDGILGWTTDSLKAIRFARRDDAALYAKLEGLTEASPVEHAWCQPRAAAAEEVQDSAREPDFLDRKIVSAAHRYLSVVALLFDSRNTPCLAERNPLTDQQCHEAFLELDTAGKALRAAMQEIRLHDSVAALVKSTDTPSDCKVSPFSSRGCERGTLGCDVVHGPQVMIESLRRELAAVKAKLDALRVDAERLGFLERIAKCYCR